MTEVTDRNEVRAAIAAGGWALVWGDLLNEADVLSFAISIPSGTVAAWVSEQVEAQVKKFSQSLDDVSDDIVLQASDYLKSLMKGNGSGERDISGLGVKGGFATYHRKMIYKVAGKEIGRHQLPNNHQPYIGVRVTKPLPKLPPSPAVLESFDSNSWYQIKNTAKPGFAIDVINDGNQLRDGKLQMAAEGNFSGQLWQLRPSKTSPGAYNLCNMWLGTGKLLDVYGDDKTKPHLTDAGTYSGQQWQIQRVENSTWKLTNSYSGALVLAADIVGSELRLDDLSNSPAYQWTLQLVGPITESGFGL